MQPLNRKRGASVMVVRTGAALSAMVVLLALLLSGVAQAQTIAVEGDHFVVDHGDGAGPQPRFLTFMSYFDGMRATDLPGDLDYIAGTLHFDGIRVLPNWQARDPRVLRDLLVEHVALRRERQHPRRYGHPDAPAETVHRPDRGGGGAQADRGRDVHAGDGARPLDRGLYPRDHADGHTVAPASERDLRLRQRAEHQYSHGGGNTPAP